MKTKIIFFAIALSAISLISSFMFIKANEVKHIVIFKYKEKATAAQIEEVTQGIKALREKIPGIVSFEYGVNNSTENLNKGFTHIYLLTFKDVASRDAYLPNPEHKKFVELLGKSDILEEPFVVDFQVKE